MSISRPATLTKLLLDDYDLVYYPENEATMLHCGEAWTLTCDGVISWWRWASKYDEDQLLLRVYQRQLSVNLRELLSLCEYGCPGYSCMPIQAHLFVRDTI